MQPRGRLTDAPDETLVRAYLDDPRGEDGSAAANALIERWSERVYRWAFRVVRERDAALDLAQDSLLQMLEALPRYEPRGRFAAWLFVIVHHRCLSAVRRRSFNVDPEIDADSLVSETAGPEESHFSAESHRRILAAMDHALDSRERTALWLRAYEGMSVEDITRILQLDTSSGARGLLQTARRKLRTAVRTAGEE